MCACVDDQHPRVLIHRSLHSWSDPCAGFPYLILLKHRESYSHTIQHKQCMLAVMWQSPGQSWDVTKSWAVLGSYIIHFIKSGSRRDNCNSLSCWYIVHWVHLQTLGSSYAGLRKLVFRDWFPDIASTMTSHGKHSIVLTTRPTYSVMCMLVILHMVSRSFVQFNRAGPSDAFSSKGWTAV